MTRWTAALAVALLAPVPQIDAADPAPVTLTEDAAGFTLANGVVTARIDKRAGTFSLNHNGLDVVSRGYWSQVGRSSAGDIAAFGPKRSAAVRIEPTANGGARAEAACRFAPEGKSAGLPCAVELRYALGRGDPAVYATAVWEHRPGDPGFSVGEARMALKLNPDVFDFLTIDADRRGPLPSGADWDRGEQLNMKEVRRITTGPFAGRVEHKYDYSAVLFDTPAYGWTSTKHRVGVWLINPSGEYLAGGPTKVELTGHLDVNPGGAPTLLNMWHGSHYGGSSLVVGEQEAWSKCVGPFLIYCNTGAGHEDLWKDALARAEREARAWPYEWAAGPDYPPKEHGGTVTGQVALNDPLAPAAKMSNLLVGLAASDESGRVDWQRDSKHYQFWVRGDADGRFRIPNVRPGNYTLHAIADGVLGEFSRAGVAVAAGPAVDLGRLEWVPVRHGRQLWEIGVPDRTAREFRHGEHFWRWGLYHDYPKEFSDDVNFVIGKSDWRKDWNYCQPPRIDGNRVTPTTWTIMFDLPEAVRGRATLRLAIAGSRTPRGVEVAVNGTPAGGTGLLPDTGVMHRDGIRGYWCERAVPFDAALLRRGPNTVKLTVPATNWVQGVLYDYLRLELDESAAPPKP